MVMQIMLIPKYLVELNMELEHHPALVKKLQKYEFKELPEKIAEIATHCGVLLDGYYEESQIEHVCGALTETLRTMRSNIITG